MADDQPTSAPDTPGQHTKPKKGISPANAAFPVKPVMGVAVVLGVYFGAMIIGETLVSIVPAFMGWPLERIQNWMNYSPYAMFIYILLVEAITVGVLLAFMKSRKAALAAIGLIKPRLRDIGVALLAYPPYFIMNIIALVTAQYVFHVDTGQKQTTGFETAGSSPELLVTFISLVILPPLVEEFVMRGFLFSSLKQGLPVIKAAVVTSIIFALAHLQIGNDAPLLWVAAIDTFILSLVLCYLRQKTGSLWPGIGLHMLKNGVAFTVLFILPQGAFGS